MKRLKDYEQNLILGGYWWRDTNGDWHYSPEDEEPNGDDIIWG